MLIVLDGKDQNDMNKKLHCPSRTPIGKCCEKCQQARREYMREYKKTPKQREYQREYSKTPKQREYQRKYQKTPKYLEYRREYSAN